MSAPARSTALGRLAFGWASAPGAGLGAIAALGALGAILLGAEFLRPREGVRLPFETMTAFYALIGAGAVMATTAAAFATGWLIRRKHPYTDDEPAAPVAADEARP